MSDKVKDPPKDVQLDAAEPVPDGDPLEDAPLQPDDPAPDKYKAPVAEDPTADTKQPSDDTPPVVEDPKEPVGDPAPPKGDQPEVVGGGGVLPAPLDAPPVASEVQPPKKSDPAVVGGGQELPFTGAETWVLVACAFMLLASGAIFRVSARREAVAEAAASGRRNVDVQFAWRNTPHGPLGGA